MFISDGRTQGAGTYFIAKKFARATAAIETARPLLSPLIIKLSRFVSVKTAIDPK